MMDQERKKAFPIFYATWANSSNILNCIFEIERLDGGIDVTVEPEQILVTTGHDTCRYIIPDIVLQPETCRGLHMLNSRELHFSIKGKLSADDDIFPMNQKTFSSQSETVDKIEKLQNKWYCTVCKQKLLLDRCILSRVLPLPSENWSDLADMWFCHNHDNQDEESPRKQGRLLPNARECFVGDTYVLIARRHVQCAGVKVTKSGTIVCKRCGRQIGEVVKQENGIAVDDQVFKFFLHALLLKDLRFADLIQANFSTGSRVELNAFFSRLLQEQSDTYASFRFLVESPPDPTLDSTRCTSSTCLLWLIDSNVRIYTSGLTSDSEDNTHTRQDASVGLGLKSDVDVPADIRTDVSTGRRVKHTGVVKVMFRCGLNSNRTTDYVTKSVISLWRKDNTVHGFQLPPQVFLQFINLLVQNCKTLSASQRYLNGFHVSFIQKADIS